MIEAYFEHVEKTIQDFPDVRSYTLSKKVYNAKQGLSEVRFCLKMTLDLSLLKSKIRM